MKGCGKIYLKSLTPVWAKVEAAANPEIPPPMMRNLEKLSEYSCPSIIQDIFRSNFVVCFVVFNDFYSAFGLSKDQFNTWLKMGDF